MLIISIKWVTKIRHEKSEKSLLEVVASWKTVFYIVTIDQELRSIPTKRGSKIVRAFDFMLSLSTIINFFRMISCHRKYGLQ